LFLGLQTFAATALDLEMDESVHAHYSLTKEESAVALAAPLADVWS